MSDNYIQGNVVMGVEDAKASTKYADLHLQQIRKLHVTVEVIDNRGKVIETIQGYATGGSLNVNGSSLIRRTGSLSLVLIDEFIPSVDSILWMTNKIRVYAGIEDMTSSDGVVTHFCLGTFYITEPQVSISNELRAVSITLEDNMMRWEKEELENTVKIEAGTPLNTAVYQLMAMYGESNVRVDFTDLKVPYLLEFQSGDTVASIITALRDLYMDWECFYDVDGTFVFRKMEIQRYDGEPVSWRFEGESDLVTSMDISFTYKEVKNRVIVIGQMDNITGKTPRAEATITNEESPFHPNRIGKQTRVINDSSYGSVDQCRSRARYELFKLSTFQEQISINTIPIYYLDANNIIEIKNNKSQSMDRYVIESISVGLSVGEEMTITGHKVYYDHFDESATVESFRKTADIIVNGIKNLGWLSLAENRINEYLGLSGDGSKLIVRFEYEGRFGTTAYVTGYTGYPTQYLTIDLADFEGSKGDSGDNGFSKADYSDRILGHEMVHAVMNNSLGVSKTMNMQNWFKEGVAEFIHGADERLKLLIVKDGKIDDTLLEGVVATAVAQLNGAVWSSDSKLYGASYLIVKYLADHIYSGKSMKDLMWSIKNSYKSGDMAVKDSIVENTTFDSYEAFVASVRDNLFNYVKVNMNLNIGVDEIDTGSIAGSDHGGVPLNAEDVFANGEAVRGLSSIGFEIEFDRI